MTGISYSRDGGLLRIVLDKPEKLNAVDVSMLLALRDAVVMGTDDDSVRAMELSGAGTVFCSGGDLGAKETAGVAAAAAAEAVRAIMSSPKPVVAAVKGAAVGFGCPLALSCDLVVAARSAFFALAFAKVGLMTDGGASALLPAAIGRVRAARMAYLSEKISAPTAFEWGMISHLADDETFDDQLASISHTLSTGPTMAYSWIKQAVRTATRTDFDALHALEVEGQDALQQSEDFREGVRAFRQHRQAHFRGR